MLRRASVMDVKEGKVTRESSFLVVAMRFYPRFLKREKVDEYARELAPPEQLFAEFKENDRKLKNHNSAFYLVRYESRFELSEKGIDRLRELSEMSRNLDVVLVCQCRDFERCHCDLLLMLAEKRFAAPIQGLIFDYPEYRERLKAERG